MNDNIEVNVDFIINNPQVMADSAKVERDVLGVADTAEKAAERVKNSLKTILSDSQGEIDAYAKSLQVASGRVADSGKNELIKLLNEDLKLGLITAKELEEEMLRINNLKFSDPVSSAPSSPKFSESFNRLSSEGLDIYRSLDPITQKLILKNIELKEELMEVSAAQKELSEAFDNGAVSGSKYSQAQAALSAKESEIKSAIKSTTAELITQGKEAELAIERVNNAGKVGYDRLGNAISKPVGQLERLKYAAKSYENMAGTSMNPDIISKYNRKFQETQIEIERTKNVGKTGFDELGNAVKNSGNAVNKFYGGLKFLANMIPGLGISGIFLGAYLILEKLIDKTDIFKSSLEKLTAVQKAVNSAYQETSSLIARETAETTLLVQRINDKNTSESTRQSLLDDFINKNPTLLKSLNLENIATAEGTKILNDYVGALRRKIELQQLEKGYADSIQKEADIKNGKEDTSIGFLGKALIVGNKIMTGQQGETFTQAIDRANNRFKANAEVEQEAITEGFKNKIEAFRKGSTDLDDVEDSSLKKLEVRLSGIKDRLRNLQKGDDATDLKERKASLEKQIKERTALLDLETPGTRNKGNRIINERQVLLNKMADLDSEFSRKSETKDQQEVEAVKAKFKEIARAVEEFNKKNPKKAISLVEFGKVETAAVDDVKARQSVEKLQTEIDTQKQIFNQFEQYKLEFGIQKANERFGSELKGFKNYIAYLRSLMPVESDKSAGANALRDLLDKAIPAAEKEQSQKAFDNTTKQLKKVLELTETAALQRLAIEKKYSEDVAAIYNDNTLGDVEKAARIRKLAEIKVIELKANKQIAFEETEFYKAAMKDVTNASIAELKQRLKEAKKEIANANLTPEERAAVKGKMTAAEQSLSDKGFSEDQYGQLINQNSETAKKAKQISEYAKAASGSFYEMADALKDIAPGTADTLETLGDIADVAANAAGAVASFASGDIVGGITGTIAAIAGVFSIGAKARESERKALAEVKEFQDKILQGEIALNIEMRSRLRTQQDINELAKVEIEARRSLLQTQGDQSKADYERQLALVQGGVEMANIRTKKHGGFLGIGRKTKTVWDSVSLAGKTYEELEALSFAGKLDEATEKLFQGLKRSKEEMDAIGDSAEELAKIITDKLTGGLTADGISNTIVQGFKDGKRALVDFADDTEEIIQNALLSALAYNFLSEPLKKLVAQFGEDAQDGLSNEEIENFESGLGATTDVFLKAAEAVEKVTGRALGGKTGISGSKDQLQKVLTEDSVNVYIGIARGSYDLQKQNLNYTKDNAATFRDQLLFLKEIAVNTAATVAALFLTNNKLDKIIENTKPSGDSLDQALRNGGVKG